MVAVAPSLLPGGGGRCPFISSFYHLLLLLPPPHPEPQFSGRGRGGDRGRGDRGRGGRGRGRGGRGRGDGEGEWIPVVRFIFESCAPPPFARCWLSCARTRTSPQQHYSSLFMSSAALRATLHRCWQSRLLVHPCAPPPPLKPAAVFHPPTRAASPPTLRVCRPSSAAW